MDAFFDKVIKTITGDKSNTNKEHWVDDGKCKACYECEAPFSVFIRRHHCRICGRVFCGNCTQNSVPPPRDSAEQASLRVCNYCFRVRQRPSGPPQQKSIKGASNAQLREEHASAPFMPSGKPPLPPRPRPSALGSAIRMVRTNSSFHKQAAGDLTWEVPQVLEDDFGLSLSDRDKLLLQQQAEQQVDQPQQPPEGALVATDQQPLPKNVIELCRSVISSVAQQHLQRLVMQLLVSEGVQQPEVWLPVVVPLATAAAHSISPQLMVASAIMDPRAYIKIKKLPDIGTPQESCLVQGVLCKRNVANRKMRSQILYPKVILLRGALEFQKVETKLSSLEVVMDEERNQLNSYVSQVAALQPDLLLVEKSVTRYAQDELLKRGISLVIMVKPELLERLARCMGTKVTPSLDQLTSASIGSCKEFRVEVLNTPGGAEPSAAAPGPSTAGTGAAARQGALPLMFFEGCPKPLGCTILLKGADMQQLVKVKKVVRFAAYAAYSLRLESALLADETAMALASTLDGGLRTSGFDSIRSLVNTMAAASADTAASCMPNGVLLTISPHSCFWDHSLASGYDYETQANTSARQQFLSMDCLASPTGGSSRKLSSSGRAGSFSFNNLSEVVQGLNIEGLSPRTSGDGARLSESGRRRLTHSQTMPSRANSLTQGGESAFASAAAAAAVAAGLAPPSLDTGPFSPPGSKPRTAEGSPRQLMSPTGTAAGSPQQVSQPRTAAGSPQESQQGPADSELKEEVFSDPLRRLDLPEGEEMDMDTLGPLASESVSAAGLGEERGDSLARASEASLSAPGVAGSASGVEEGSVAPGEAGQSGSTAVSAVSQLLALQGKQVYDYQRIHITMSARNPKRALLCEPPSIKPFGHYSSNDVSLQHFILAITPAPHKRCTAAGCGDGMTAHVRTFMHGSSRITISIATLPATDALPGDDKQQIWLWLRPKGMGHSAAHAVRRIPLSPESAYMSIGQHLQLVFTGEQLEVAGRSLHHDFVRYYGVGRTVICMYQDHITPYQMQMPELVAPYSLHAQLKWLKQEGAELCQEADEAFEVVELSLREHPYFQAMVNQQELELQHGVTPSGASEASSTSPSHAGLLSTALKGDTGSPPSLPAMIAGVRKDRSSFMERVSDSVRRATPMQSGTAVQPGSVGGATLDVSTGGTGTDAFGNPCSMMWDEQVMCGILELNKLRRCLAVTLLSWAATLQDPAAYAQAYQRESALTAFSNPSAAPSLAPSSSAAAAELSWQAGSTTEGRNTSVTSSDGGASLFGIAPSVAAQRMGLAAMDVDGVGEGLHLPIVPSQSGPIAVHVVAGLVARASGSLGGALPVGELLEGSQSVMNMVSGHSRRVSQFGDVSFSPPRVDDSAHRAGDPSASRRSRRSNDLGHQNSVESLGTLAPTPGVNTPGAVITPDASDPEDNGDDGPAGDSDDDEAEHPGFWWMNDDNVGEPMLDDDEKFYPQQEQQAEDDEEQTGRTASSQSGRGSFTGGGASGSFHTTYSIPAVAGASSQNPGGSGGGAFEGPTSSAAITFAAAQEERTSKNSSIATSPLSSRHSKPSFPKRHLQNVRKKLEHLASNIGGLSAIARVCLPGRAMMPPGINDTIIPIYDSEPTSIIAYFLSTRAYQLLLNAAIKSTFQELRKSTTSEGNLSWGLGPGGISQLHMNPSLATMPSMTSMASTLHSSPSATSLASGGSVLLQQQAAQPSGQQQQPPGAQPPLQQASGETLEESDWLTLLLSKAPAHVRHSFEDDAPGMPWARAKFQVIAYYAPQFAELRRRCVQGGEAAFMSSLCRCRRWSQRGGKSNAYFAKTRDDRYIVKSLSKAEKASFLEFAPAYFEHMAKRALSGGRTCLAKVLGVFSVSLKPATGNGLGIGKDGVIDLLVMENCFYDRQISRIYDLKGSERNRFNNEAASNPQDSREVHLDDNLRKANLTSPLLVEPQSLREMQVALWADTAFLANLDIMDYSLLVGLDKENNCLAVAIIDFIRQYTWDKQLETWVKSSGMLGGNGKEPTIISPKQYMRRFRQAMLSYFTVVPSSADVEPDLDPDAP